jgi:hypothetical protein
MKNIFRLWRVWLTKIQLVGWFVLLTGFLALLSGCSSPGSQQSAAPTVSGYISVGAQQNFNSSPSNKKTGVGFS